MGGLIGIGDLQKYADFIRSVPLSIVVTRSQAFPQPQVEFLVVKATLSQGDYVVTAKLNLRNLTASTQTVVTSRLVVGTESDVNANMILFKEEDFGSIAIPFIVGANVNQATEARLLMTVLTPDARIGGNNAVMAAMLFNKVIVI